MNFPVETVLKFLVQDYKVTLDNTIDPPLPSTVQDLGIWQGNFFKQSNSLVEAVFEQPFKEFELKILSLISKYISKNNSLPFDEQEKLIRISINKKEFCASLNIDPQHFYHMAKSIAPDFHKKSILIEIFRDKNTENKTKKEFHSMSLVPRISCKDNQITFWISPILQPYLQKLKVEYTLLSLEYISKMGSSYAIKIYQLLAQYQNIKERKFSVSELKRILGIPSKYRDFQRFKEEVIETAIKHINQNSNLKVSFELEKIGKKIEIITFKISTKETQFQRAVKEFTNEMDEILKRENVIYLADHKELQKKWKGSKKNIQKHQNLFDEWIKERTENYQAESVTPLQLKENSKWYEKFQQKDRENFLKELDNLMKRK